MYLQRSPPWKWSIRDALSIEQMKSLPDTLWTVVMKEVKMLDSCYGGDGACTFKKGWMCEWYRVVYRVMC